MIYFKSLYISYFQSLMNLFNYHDNCLKEILRIEYLREGGIFFVSIIKNYMLFYY